MWIALLVGLGLGFLGLFLLQLKLQRDLRMLLSDAHLAALVERFGYVARADDGAEATTFCGVALSLGVRDGQRRLWLRAGKGVPPVGVPWVVAVVSELAGVPPEATRTDRTHVWMALPDGVLPNEPYDLNALRARVADRLKDVRISSG